MELKDYVEKIKDYITGFGLLNSELPDEAYAKIVNNVVRELNNYYNVTELKTVDSTQCVDLNEYPRINDVIAVHRKESVQGSQGTSSATIADPSYMSYIQMYNPYAVSQNQIYRLASYTLGQQFANTFSTDLAHQIDERNRKLYINYSQGVPDEIVIEYVPKLNDASEVLTPYWQDILYRLSLADAKVALGRIRTRYVQSNALYTDDGETILAEGLAEGSDLRARLKEQADMVMPID